MWIKGKKEKNVYLVVKIHLFVVHIGEIHPVHLHNLVSNLHFGIRHKCSSQQAEMWVWELQRSVLVILKDYLKSNFCRQGVWLDVTDVDTRLLGWTTRDANAHAFGTHKAEKNLLLLDFFTSNGRQACNAAFFLLWNKKANKLSNLKWKKAIKK